MPQAHRVTRGSRWQASTELGRTMLPFSGGSGGGRPPRARPTHSSSCNGGHTSLARSPHFELELLSGMLRDVPLPPCLEVNADGLAGDRLQVSHGLSVRHVSRMSKPFDQIRNGRWVTELAQVERG